MKNKQTSMFFFLPVSGYGLLNSDLFTHRFHKYLRQEIIQFSLEAFTIICVLKMRKPMLRGEKDFQIFHSGNGILKT